MESSKNYDRNVPASTKLSRLLPRLTEVLPKRHLLEPCRPQHAGALQPPSALVGQSRKARELHRALLGPSAGSPRPASQGSEQLPRHAGRRSERLLKNSRGFPRSSTVFSCNSLLKSGSQGCEKRYHKSLKRIASTCKAARRCQVRSTTNAGFNDCRRSWTNWRH